MSQTIELAIKSYGAAVEAYNSACTRYEEADHTASEARAARERARDRMGEAHRAMQAIIDGHGMCKSKDGW
jgi:hypothetical protein